jgi:SNF2 family DNA or RNA helicase
MRISKTGNTVYIDFFFNPIIIEVIKTIDGREFDGKSKKWSVPVSQLVEVVNLLKLFRPVLDPDVQELYDGEVKLREDLTRIKLGQFTEEEKTDLSLLNIPCFEYQKQGILFLKTCKSALMGDEPGLGKTLQSLSVSVLVKAKKVLIICPSSLKLNWQDEINKWFKLPSTVVEGSPSERQAQWDADVIYYIVNYECMLRDIELIKSKKWDMIIADEATRISNPKAKQAKAIKTIPCQRKLALTGTPFNNAVQDLWNVLDFCEPNYLGSFWRFTEKYCVKNRFNSIEGYQNLDSLASKIEKRMIRRLKKDVLHELPDKIYENVFITPAKREQEIYEAVKEEILSELNAIGFENENINNILTKLIRLRQSADSLELVSDYAVSSKLDALKELLTDLINEDKKAIIFTEFSEMAKILERELSQYRPLLYIGETDVTDRHEYINLFNTDNEHKLIIMSSAGGYGLNLQRASYVIHYDLPWSIAKTIQREDRAHRLGQKSSVTIFRMLMKDTIDEYILDVLHRKQAMSKELLRDKDYSPIVKVRISRQDLKRLLS